MKPRPVGRPPRAGKHSTERIELRVTPAERKRWERQAAKDGVSVSAWIRQQCERELMRVASGDPA